MAREQKTEGWQERNGGGGVAEERREEVNKNKVYVRMS
jgi:hypothetical protein